MTPNTHPMQMAWQNYRIARSVVCYPSDKSGVRHFVRSIFVRCLKQAWDEVKTAARHSASMKARNDAALALFDADHARRVAVWANATPQQIATEIGHVRHDLANLMFLPLHVDMGKRERELKANLAALETLTATLTQEQAAA